MKCPCSTITTMEKTTCSGPFLNTMFLIAGYPIDCEHRRHGTNFNCTSRITYSPLPVIITSVAVPLQPPCTIMQKHTTKQKTHNNNNNIIIKVTLTELK